jgi:hypothetical protein
MTINSAEIEERRRTLLALMARLEAAGKALREKRRTPTQKAA